MTDNTQAKHETRMRLTIPGRGTITLEGKQRFVEAFFNDVRHRFIEDLQVVLRSMELRGDIEVIETHCGKRSQFEVVERD